MHNGNFIIRPWIDAVFQVACESDCQPHGIITVPGIFTSLEQQYDNPVPECMRNADNPQYEVCFVLSLIFSL